jgi:hypothetical protein
LRKVSDFYHTRNEQEGKVQRKKRIISDGCHIMRPCAKIDTG